MSQALYKVFDRTAALLCINSLALWILYGTKCFSDHADWRVAGMTYLKYANLCADMVRAALKEPMKAKAKAQEVIYFRSALWKDGVPQKQGKNIPIALENRSN